MNHQVQVFEIARDAKPEERPQPAEGFAVTADTNDEVRRAALARLKSDGRTVRSISFLADGGLAVVVTQPAPAPAAPLKARRARGGR